MTTSDVVAEPTDVVLELSRLVFVEHEVRRAFETYVAADYIQHNPDVADGREAAITFLSDMLTHVPDLDYSIKRVLTGPGGLVALHVHGIAVAGGGDRGRVVVDIYRVENGLIVEHWDSVQEIPAHAANAHPMF